MKRELVVGLVFAVLLGVLLGVTLWVENPGFFKKKQEAKMSAWFHDVGGLRAGDEVWIYGTKAGRVEALVPDQQKGGVEVQLLLDYEPVMRENADVKITQRSALGGAVVAVHPGTPDKPVVKKAVYQGRSVDDPFKAIGEAISELKGPLKETIEAARNVLTDVSGKSDRIIANLDATVENARSISDEIRSGKGTIGQLMKDDTLYTDLKEAVASLKKIGDDANGGGGTIDVLLHDTVLASDLKTSVANLRGVSDDLAAGRGTIGKLLKDDSIYMRLDATLKDVEQFAGDAKNGKGLLGKLLYDEELAKRVDTISGDIAEVTGKLRRGEGSLGKLLNDEELYADIKDAVRKVGGGVDDVRENAPVLAFAGFLFSGF